MGSEMCVGDRLKRLRISNGWQTGCFIPDVTLLPALEKLECSAETLPQLARCWGLKKFTFFLGHTGSGTDFLGFSCPSELEELMLNVESATQDTEKLGAFWRLPKLRKIAFSCGQGILPLHVFPMAARLTMFDEAAKMNGGSPGLRILAVAGEDAPALEKLSVFALGAVRFEDYRSTALRELCLGSCGIDSLTFTKAFPNLELLNISDDRVEDIAPFTALPKFRHLCYMDNVARNIGLLKDRGTVPIE